MKSCDEVRDELARRLSSSILQAKYSGSLSDDPAPLGENDRKLISDIRMLPAEGRLVVMLLLEKMLTTRDR